MGGYLSAIENPNYYTIGIHRVSFFWQVGLNENLWDPQYFTVVKPDKKTAHILLSVQFTASHRQLKMHLTRLKQLPQSAPELQETWRVQELHNDREREMQSSAQQMLVQVSG